MTKRKLQVRKKKGAEQETEGRAESRKRAAAVHQR